MYCNKCAVKVNDEDEYCFNCGNKLKQESIVKDVEVDVNNSKRVTVFDVFAILGFIFSIISLVLSVFLGIVDVFGVTCSDIRIFVVDFNLVVITGKRNVENTGVAGVVPNVAVARIGHGEIKLKHISVCGGICRKPRYLRPVELHAILGVHIENTASHGGGCGGNGFVRLGDVLHLPDSRLRHLVKGGVVKGVKIGYGGGAGGHGAATEHKCRQQHCQAYQKC